MKKRSGMRARPATLLTISTVVWMLALLRAGYAGEPDAGVSPRGDRDVASLSELDERLELVQARLRRETLNEIVNIGWKKQLQETADVQLASLKAQIKRLQEQDPQGSMSLRQGLCERAARLHKSIHAISSDLRVRRQRIMNRLFAARNAYRLNAASQKSPIETVLFGGETPAPAAAAPPPHRSNSQPSAIGRRCPPKHQVRVSR